MKTVHVLGLGRGPEDLTSRHLELIAGAEVLAGGARLLEFFPDHPGERLELKGPLEDWLGRVESLADGSRVVVLASGDPGFFGIGARLVERLGAANVEIHPNVSMVQAAFSRLKLSWQDARVVSLHGRNTDGKSMDALWDALQDGGTLALFTDPHNSPDRVARRMLGRDQTGWAMWVLENLGEPSEQVRRFTLEEAAGWGFTALNLVVLEPISKPDRLFLGMPEDSYRHQAGLITKSEVRLVALGRLELGPGQTVWDLGAGCGSVGLEATLLVPGGRVVAVERRPERLTHIFENRRRYGAARLEVKDGDLPDALESLPRPHRVFIGGGGQNLPRIIARAAEDLWPGGVMLVSMVLLESLDNALEAMGWAGLTTDIIQVSVSRSESLAGGTILKALNPVWLLRGRKGGEA